MSHEMILQRYKMSQIKPKKMELNIVNNPMYKGNHNIQKIRDLSQNESVPLIIKSLIIS